ncbi:MAG TPA: glycosyltransferase, partial [Blastocatellia bacterium]|nr:glycosyltransferase [Blastocatellia bacterium]
PVISTSVGAEGLPVKNGVELLLADTPEAFADAVVRVLMNEPFARELGERAATTVRTQFGWDRVADCFAEACHRAIYSSKRDRAAASVKKELQTTV